MKTDHALVFESLPTSGLANQLRGLTSAILLAQDTSRDFYLSWNKHQDMPDISLADLFREPTFADTSITGDSFSWLQRRRFVHRDRELLGLSGRLKKALYAHHQFNSLGIDMTANALRPSEPLILISSYYSYAMSGESDLHFYQRRHALYQEFLPVPDVEEAVLGFTQENFGAHTLGIHLRTGISMRNAKEGIADANHFWPEGIPFPLFFELIDDEIGAHPDTRILLATDNTRESAPITERYGDRILMYPKKTDDGMVGRSALADQKGALIDLLLLARCQKIIGTYNSTFSYEAAVMGDVPLLEMSPMGLRQQQKLGGDQPILVDFRDRILCPIAHHWKADDVTRAQARNSGEGAHPSVSRFRQEIQRQSNAIVLDYHAETGQYPLVAGAVPDSLFYVFEENPENVPLLMANIRLNNLDGRITVITSAATHDGSVRTLPRQTIDELVATENLKHVSLIRGRADGDMDAMLRGAHRTLEVHQPRIWLENTRKPEDQATRIQTLPEIHGYHVEVTESGDFLCVPADAAKR